MLRPEPDIETLRRTFRWEIPERYNIGVDICDRWAEAEPDRLALIDVREGRIDRLNYADLRARSNRLANALAAADLIEGPVGILLPQCAETAIAHIATLKGGGISLPLFTQFGPDALRHRLADSRARVVITDAAGAATLETICGDLPDLETVLRTDDGSLAAACAGQPETFEPVDTAADDPAILIYTSGTTGNPKGALQAHRTLLGHLPGVEMAFDFFPKPGDVIWTPADWAWIGGLLDVLMPALHHGVPVVAHRFARFSGEAAFALMRDHGVTVAFLPPTALKLMRQVDPSEAAGLRLRTVGSGGETLGAELIDWGRRVLGCTINEFYGQTECNVIVASCAALAEAEPGVMGFPVPGHEVALLDPETGQAVPDGEEGEIAVLSPDPVMFLGYLDNADATAAKFVDGPQGRWLLTGDRGVRTASGRIRFVGRGDDVISSGGYRIGPSEIEDCLLTHPAVRLAGVVGAPDDLRGEVVVAFVQLAPGQTGSPELAEEIAAHVRARLAGYQAPRQVRFVDEMPMTTTGKIIRKALRAAARADPFP